MSKRSYSLALLLAFIWSNYYIISKVTIERTNPFFHGFVVRLITFFLLTSYLGFQGKLKELFNTKGAVSRLLTIGLLGFLLDLTAFLGLQYSTATNASILLKTDILFANLLTIIILKKRFGFKCWAATFAMIAGVLMVMDVNILEFRFTGFGDLLLVASAFFVTLNAFVIKNVLNDSRVSISDEVVAYYNNFVCLILFGILTVLNEGKALMSSTMKQHDLIALFAAGGLIQTLIYVFYYYNLRRLPVWIVKIFLLFMPVFASIIAYFVLNERLDFMQLIGMVIVIAGAVVIILSEERKPRICR